MTFPISSITHGLQAARVAPVAPITPAAGAASAPAAAGMPGQFSSVLEGAIQGIESYGNKADQAVQSLINGDGGELHTVALAVQRADLAFDLGLQIRNKVVSAYQEVMRMQL